MWICTKTMNTKVCPRNLLTITRVGAYLTAIAVLCLLLFTHQHQEHEYSPMSDNEIRYVSRQMKRELINTLHSAEGGGDLDTIIRDAFLNRIWPEMNDGIVGELVLKLKRREFVKEDNNNTINKGSNRANKSSPKKEKNALNENTEIQNGSTRSQKTTRNATQKQTFKLKEANSSITQNSAGISVSKKLHYNVSMSPKRSELDEFLSLPVKNTFLFPYRHSQDSVCNGGDDVRYIIAVPSAPHNFWRRTKVRRTERAIFAKNKKNHAKVLFFLGFPPPSNSSKVLQDRIDDEQAKYGDIVQTHFIDSYKNLTKKSAMMLDWSSRLCSNAKFLIRTDDDVFLNITKMISAMEYQSTKMDHYILGKMKHRMRVIRKVNSKYYMPYNQWPDETFPDFLLGGSLGLPVKTSALLLEAMRRVSLVWLDDVFVTGICSKYVAVPIFNSTAFMFNQV